MRARLAGLAYMARFEWLLDTMEREDYSLRPKYDERKSIRFDIVIKSSGTQLLFGYLVDDQKDRIGGLKYFFTVGLRYVSPFITIRTEGAKQSSASSFAI